MNVPRRVASDPIVVSAVVDTNVLLDIFSCHDLAQAYSNGTDVRYRHCRARNSLLLAMYFHAAKVVTYSLSSESLRKLLEFAPPELGDSPHHHFTSHFVNFVRPNLLPNWSIAVDDEIPDLSSNEADAHLLEFARDNQVILITNEDNLSRAGKRRKGRNRKLVEIGRRMGVTVQSPESFLRCQADFDEITAIGTFFREFREQAPSYVESHTRRSAANLSLAMSCEYYRHVLLGTELNHGVTLIGA